jgi:hypothetical protein
MAVKGRVILCNNETTIWSANIKHMKELNKYKEITCGILLMGFISNT